MIDGFTGWTEAVPIADQTAETVSKAFFDSWISRFGAPERVHTDQGAQFESAVFARTCELLGIQRSHTTPYRPQANGKIERFNRTLIQMLRKCMDDNPGSWEEHIPSVLMAYRSTPSKTTGFTPHKLVFGREMRLGVDYGLPFPELPSSFEDLATRMAKTLEDSYKLARESIGNNRLKAKSRYDKN